MSKRLLIIDDDKKLQDLLKEYLSPNGFAVAQSFNGDEGIRSLKSAEPSLVILDIMMPGKDGFEVLKEIRAISRVPVIMLTARGEDTDRIIGLEMGADDYLPKPFNPRELLARIKSVLRRSDARSESKMETVESGGFVLDSLEGSISWEGKTAELSSTELAILQALMKNPNRVFSRDDLMNIARGRDAMAFERSVDVHISRVRDKLETLSGMRNVIKTVWGRGYLFVDRNRR